MKHDHLTDCLKRVFIRKIYVVKRNVSRVVSGQSFSGEIVAEDRFNSPNKALCVWGIGERTRGLQ